MVGSGAYQDPKDFQGLAHFVEHVVHHGSEKFKDENGLRNFLGVRPCPE
jgi:secreted Zn-dependent insulinase-like peptidase